MKIASPGLSALTAAPPVVEAAGAAPVSPSAPAPSFDTGATHGTMQAARAALKEMPEIDEAKVAAVRDALSRGEISFDPAKLAGLIERYHGGKG